MPPPEQGSPLWWLVALDKRRRDRNRHLRRYDDYYEGDHPLVYASEQFRLAFGGMFESFSDNWLRLVVDAVRERLTVTGFGLPEGKTSKTAWKWWQANQLDAEFQVGLTESIKASEASLSVWRGADGSPSIAVEDPQQTIVAYAAGSRRHRVAALKVWADEWTNQRLATVYLPDAIYKYQSSGALGDTGLWIPSLMGEGSSWAPRETVSEPWPLPNPLGVVPIIPLVNNPRLRPDKRTGLWGSSEIDSVLANQDAINKLVADLMLTSDAAGFPAKWATGVEPPTDPATGQLVPSWKLSVLKIHTVPDADAKFGSFTAADLANNVKAIESRIQSVASQSRTPPHYFYLRGEFPSGESLKSAEAGLVAKAKDKIAVLSEGVEEAMMLAFDAADVPRPPGWERMEALWADPEYHTESQRADAAVKLHQAGVVPLEQTWIDLGYSPTQRDQMRAMRLTDALLAPRPDEIAELAELG